MSQTIIEVTAADYCGKTVQAEMLTYWTLQHPHNFGSYGRYGDAIPHGLSRDEDWDWWHVSTSLQEFGGALINAYNARQAEALAADYDFAVVERGASMVRAQIVANFATRHCTEVAEFIDPVDSLANQHLLPVPAPARRIEFSLVQDEDWASAMASRMHTRRFDPANNGFTPAQNDFYAAYQRNLATALAHYRDTAGNDLAMIKLDQPAVDIQNQIRSHPKVNDLALPQLMEQDPVLLGMAGLSECGKGRIAQELAERAGFTRLKIGFFNEMTRGNARYAKPRDMAMSIVRFIANSRHLQRVTFESLHNPSLACEMKELLGERWKTVYIEVPDEVRTSRLLQQSPDTDPAALLAEQKAKDATKSSQSVEAHRNIADIIVDNSGSLDVSITTILQAIHRQAQTNT